MNNSTKQTHRINSNYNVKLRVEDGQLGVLDSMNLAHLDKSKSSILWFTASSNKSGELSPWSVEVDIQEYVKMALVDCIKAANLEESLMIKREETLSVADAVAKGNRTDLAVFVDATSHIMGVAEVKVPGFDFKNVHQIVDYMIDLRNSFNVRFVFGIMTTYEEWRIYWLEDTDEAAKETSKEKFDELCMAGSANEYMINDKVTVYQSKIYKHSEVELIECLASVLYKMAHSPVYLPSKFIDLRSRYVHMTRTDFKFSQLPSALKQFKYAMPSPRTVNCYILSYFHRGGDGRVALASSETGNLTVIKFLNDANDSNGLEKESQYWRDLWNVECRIVEYKKRCGLLMPFCMTFNPNSKMGQRVSSLSTWNKRLGNVEYNAVSEELEPNLNMEMLEYYQDNPLVAARRALDVLVEKCIKHEDLDLRHLALLPILNVDTGLYDLKPIFIDLTRVSILEDVQSAKDAAQEGYQFLESQFITVNKHLDMDMNDN